MTKNETELTGEFASAMQQLVAEASKTSPHSPSGTKANAQATEPEQMRAEITKLNERIAGLERMMAAGFEKLTANSAPPAVDPAPQLQRIDEHLVALRNTESVNHRLFNSLHQELKDYRDNFLRDSLQKPFIRDLIVLFDDLTVLSAQLQSAGTAADGRMGPIGQWCDNLENSIHALTEILHRMEVLEIEPRETVDRALHRVVTYEPADFAEEDEQIIMRVKRGFLWRNQVLRQEEVVAKRFG